MHINVSAAFIVIRAFPIMFVYSCPYQYAEKKTVDLRITESTLEIYYEGERLTTHNLFPEYVNNRYSTHEEDMPPEFRKIKPWDDERIRNWAARIDPNTLKVINCIFSSVPIKEQGYSDIVISGRLCNRSRNNAVVNAI